MDDVTHAASRTWTTCRLDADRRRALDTYAERLGCSRSDLVRDAVGRLLDDLDDAVALVQLSGVSTT